MRASIVRMVGVATIAVVAAAAACINPREGYAPEQPLHFSHQLHAGQNQIPCRYCHVSVGEGPHASVPSINICMNCHNPGQVGGNDKEGRAQIAKLRAAWESGEPIEWVKVHDLPDHARFSHMPHTNAGVDCSSCHGQVNTMEVIQVTKPFNMGWCVNCHRQPEYNAPIDCVTCHY